MLNLLKQTPLESYLSDEVSEIIQDLEITQDVFQKAQQEVLQSAQQRVLQSQQTALSEALQSRG